MPEGGEDVAHAFYHGILSLTPIEKPEALQGRGGLWYHVGMQQLHLGVERPFAPAKKAHIAFQVNDLATIRAAVALAGLPVVEDVPLPGIERFHTTDPFGNRVEIVSVVSHDDQWF